jgi:hypothetical protein
MRRWHFRNDEPYAFSNTTSLASSPFFLTLSSFRTSPLHLFFIYVIPLVPLVFSVDGYILCIRGRTDKDLDVMLRSQKDPDSSELEFKSTCTGMLASELSHPMGTRLVSVQGSSGQRTRELLISASVARW